MDVAVLTQDDAVSVEVDEVREIRRCPDECID
jgi:hypothetical protein